MCLIQYDQHLLAWSRRIALTRVEPRSENGNSVTADHVPYRVFLSPERQENVAAVVDGSLKREELHSARKRRKIRKEHKSRNVHRGRKGGNVREKRKEKGEKMAESAASPGSVQVAANSPQQQQQQSQQQQQTQQNQQPPDISSSQLASPPITGTGTNRKRSRSSGRVIFNIYRHSI